MAPKKETQPEKRERGQEELAASNGTKKQKKSNDAPREGSRRSARQAAAPSKPKAAEEPKKTATKEKKPTSTAKKEEGPTSSTDKGSGAKKTHGSKHDSTDNPSGTSQASKDRLPSTGTVVHWKAMPGWVKGEVVEIVKDSKSVQGKSIKASEQDPRSVEVMRAPSASRLDWRLQCSYPAY